MAERRPAQVWYIEPTEELIKQLTQELESARDQLQLLSAREEGLRETIVSQKKEIEQLKELVTASRPGGYTQHGGERASNGSVVAHLGRLVLGDGTSEFFAGSTTGVHFVLSAQQLYQTTFSSQEHFPECLFRLHILRPNGSPVALEQPMSVESCLGDGHLTSDNIFESLRNHLRIVGVVAIREAFDKYQQCWGILYPVLLSKQFLDTFDDTINDAWTTSMEPHLRVPFLLQVYALIALQSIHSSTAATESRPLSYHLDTILSNLLGHMPCRGDIPSLQGLVLYLLYLQTASQHSLAVRVCGMVVRLAQSLGLHRHTRRFKHSPGENTDTDLPTNTDYDDMHSDQLSYPLPGETTHIEPFLQCLEQMYTTTNRRGGVAKIFRLQRELDLWKQNVQSSLPNVARTGELIQTRLHNRNNNNTAYNPVEHPDIISLWLFILGELATMLIHRPALTFGQQEPQFADSLRSCKEATTHLILAFELASEVSFTPHIWPSGHHLVLQSGLMLLYDRWVQTPTQRPDYSSSLWAPLSIDEINQMEIFELTDPLLIPWEN
ncbi:hypothetical protein APSETT444_007029 [Aspergillus pseudonomiae]